MIENKRKKIILSLGVSVLALSAGNALANPEDPTVQAGQVTFSQTATKLDVHQSSDKAVIDWRSFNIAPNEHTEFHQPTSSSFTLNRVNSTDPSVIQGRLSANGNIAIINPNGVYFETGSVIDVGGLIATTSDIDNADFMNGTLDFNQAGHASAEIVNKGNITAAEGGLIGLVAPNVENEGVIEARLGRIELVSGDTFTLDMAGDGLINVAIGEDQIRKIRNSGQISADGGYIKLAVTDAIDVVDALVVNTGSIKANSVGMQNGKIILFAGGSNGSDKTGNAIVLNEGEISAKGLNTGETGGEVELLADHVGVMDNASIDVSGDQGAGRVLVGGEYQGQGDTQTAKVTYVANTAKIKANSITDGNGGEIIIWADDTTRYYGDIEAEGGTNSGNGGFVEVSGKKNLVFDGEVSTLAQNGEDGTLLLDPTDIVISNAVNNNVTAGTTFEPNVADGPSNLNVTTLLNALASGNVTVQTIASGSQDGNITVADALSWSANSQLTLNAHNKITVNADITARNRLTLIASDVDLNADLYEHSSGASLFLQPNATNITVGLAGGAGDFNLSVADLDHIQAGWNRVYIGNSTSSANMDIGAYTWNTHTQFYNRTGELQVNGAQNFQNFDAFFQTRSLSINSTLSGTGALQIFPDSNISLGLAGEAGTLNLSTAELDFIQDGFSYILFGRSNSNQALNVGAYNWRDDITLRTGSGGININGAQDFGSGSVSLESRTININAAINGTGSATLRPDGNITIGVNGAAGTMQIDSVMLGNFSTFGSLNIGNTGMNSDINVNAWIHNHNLQLSNGNGTITINGDQNVGSNDFTLESNYDPVINGNLIGSGTLNLRPTAATVSTGIAGGAGTFNLTAAELDRIQNGWDQIVIGQTGNDQNITVNAYTWLDNVRFQNDEAAIVIDGEQNFGDNNFTLVSDRDPEINANLIGTGIIRFESEADNRTIYIGGAGGNLNFSNAELDRIIDGWNQIVFGQSSGTGEIRVSDDYSWNDNVEFLRSTGNVRIDNAQNFGANNLTITAGNIALSNTISGSGTLTIQQSTADRSFGLAGGSGQFVLDATEAARIQDGWSEIIFGRSDSTSIFNIRAFTWNDNVKFLGGTGEMRVEQAINMLANYLVIESDNLRIDNTITGTGDLTIQTSDATASIGLAGEAGDLDLTSAELDFLSDGWNSITIGRSDGTGALNVGSYTNWQDPITLLKNGTNLINAININGLQSNAASSDASLSYNGNTILNANITTDDTNLAFSGPLSLGGNITLTTGQGNLSFDVLDGNHNLSILSLGNVSFTGNVGNTARLADVSIDGSADITSTGNFKADNLTIANVTATANFANADILNTVDIDAENIRGSYIGTDGLLNANSGTVDATVSFGTLDINGIGATLLGGYIGAAGSNTQNMANLITINGITMPSPDPAFTFAGFQIGFIPAQNSIPPQTTNIITQSLAPLHKPVMFKTETFGADETDTKEISVSENDYLSDDFETDSQKIIYVHKNLLN
nr:filamentous hemagglutinin N-terminal domain-containing protein [Cytophagales bacterium]